MKIKELLEKAGTKKIKEVSTTNENFLRNLVGDIRNAFKPGVAVTPNMVQELEAGLAAIQRGEQPTRRQQATLDNFMSDTLARELKKTFNINISETTAGAVAAVATPVGGLVSRQPRNADGTAKNALDQDNILSNGKPKSKSKNSKPKSSN